MSTENPQSRPRRSLLEAHFPRLAICALALLPLLVATPEAEAHHHRDDSVRTWTSSDGKKLEASLVEFGDGEVTLKLASGREAILPIERFSEEDQAFLAETRRQGGGRTFAPLPPETRLSEAIDVEGGPRVFRTPRFQFETGDAVSRAFIAEAARVYEGTWAALEAFPHGLDLQPPSDRTHFHGRFLPDRQFDEIAQEKMGTLPGQRVVGLYLGDSQELLVPFSSLGARKLGSRLTLRKSSDTSTLVHEIVHQLMHEWLPVLPTWFSEGFAEYLASVPYQNGRFEFRSAERGLTERLQAHYGAEGREISGVLRPSTHFAGLMAPTLASKDPEERGSAGAIRSASGRQLTPAPGSLDRWSGSVTEYRDALLLVYFLTHLDEPENPGARVGQYLRSVDIALGETEEIRRQVAEFEEKRLAYNESVRDFNQKLEVFRKQVDAYNSRVLEHNRQARAGIPASDRVDVGEIPLEPTVPEKLEVPESILVLAGGEGAIDLVDFVQRRSLTVLLRGRSPAELDRAMQAAYEEAGWTIRYR